MPEMSNCKREKRVVFTDSDCHMLIDVVFNYKHIIECKKTDSVTWKEKIAAWGKIAEEYNMSNSETRTFEQLRCKYDNLKKEVRKYKSASRQSQLNVKIRKSTESLYNKIYDMIRLPVDGLPPCQGDSDLFVGDVVNTYAHVEANTVEQEPNILLQNDDIDWSNYNPKMLRGKRSRVLRNFEEVDKGRKDLQELKRQLLLKEHDLDEQAHKQHIELEKETHRRRMEMLEQEYKQKIGNERRRMEMDEEAHRKRMEKEHIAMKHDQIMMQMNERKLQLEIAFLENELKKAKDQ